MYYSVVVQYYYRLLSTHRGPEKAPPRGFAGDALHVGDAPLREIRGPPAT